MAEVTKIALTLENCEVLTFDRRDVGDFWCKNIHETTSRIASNSIRKHKLCDELFLELHNTANEPRQSPFERLCAYGDITWVEITYDDGTTDDCAVPWNDIGHEVNGYQSTYLSVPGNLYIYIGKEGSVAGVVNLDEIDDAEYMDFKWGMYTL